MKMSEIGSTRSSISSTSSKPIPREQAFLETFFCTVGQFWFDKAHEAVEKEKEQFKPSPGSIWSSFLSVLLNFTNAEKNYFTLSYVEKKLLRREVIRPLYNTLLSDFQKIDELKLKVEFEGNFDEVEILAIELSRHLCQFVQARQDMIDFYVFMAKSGWTNIESKTAFVNYVEEVLKKHSKHFHHPLLDPIKSSFGLEVEITHQIFQCELLMSQWKFLPSLLLLYECQGKLNSWNTIQFPGGQRDSLASPLSAISHLSGTRKYTDLPFLYKWLGQFHQALVSKFTFYFHTTLISQTNSNDMKTLTSKSSVDYFAKVTTFIRKSDAYNVSLILDTTLLEESYCGHGYHLPNLSRKRPEGLKSYPAVVTLPEAEPLEHWPNVVSLLKDREQELNSSDRIVHFFDETLKVTYYLSRVDTRMALLAVFNVKKKERDTYVLNFFSEIKSLLVHEKLYQMLKPGQAQKFRH